MDNQTLRSGPDKRIPLRGGLRVNHAEMRRFTKKRSYLWLRSTRLIEIALYESRANPKNISAVVACPGLGPADANDGTAHLQFGVPGRTKSCASAIIPSILARLARQRSPSG